MSAAVWPQPREGADSNRVARLVALVDTTDATGCWPFMGVRERGYGRIMVDKVREPAHRLSFRLFVGDVPAGMILRHRCDRPCCVNPAHLEVGTPADNARDCVERGRRPRGEAAGGAKLTTPVVLAIVAARNAGVTESSASRGFGISRTAIRKIMRGVTWSHVTGIVSARDAAFLADVLSDSTPAPLAFVAG